MKPKALIAILSVLIVCCHSGTENNANNQPTSFMNFYSRIPEVNLPFTCYCNKQLSPFKNGISDSAIKKYSKIADAMVYKKLPSVNDAYRAIIYLIPADVLVPVLITYTDSGKEIARLTLYEKHCGEDEFSSGLTWAEITDEKKIIVHDSSSEFKRDASGNIMEETKKIRIIAKEYKLDKTGRIILENEPRKKNEEKI